MGEQIGLVSRRQFLHNAFPQTSGNSESGLDDIIRNEEDHLRDESAMGRRESLKVLGAGLAGVAATIFPLDEAEAQGRPRILVGTPASLAKQRRMFREDNLSMLYEKDLRIDGYFVRDKRLVVVNRDTPHYYVDDVEFGNALARPYASLLLQRLSQQFYDRFNDRQKVTGLTRSVEYQNYLRTGRMRGMPNRRRNRNATLPENSPHVRGAGVDISYVPMNSRQRQWMRDSLVELERADCIEASEEIGQQHTFHVMVFKNYARYVQKRLGMDNENFAAYYERMTGGRIY